MMRKALWCALLTLPLAGCRPATSAPAQDNDEAAILAASRAFSDAYVAGDTATIRGLYTEDAILLPPGRRVEGRDAIARYFAPGPNRRNLEHAMSSTQLEITGDVAVDIGMWSNTWATGDAEPQSASEAYLVVWRRGADDMWRIDYDMWHRP